MKIISENKEKKIYIVFQVNQIKNVYGVLRKKNVLYWKCIERC